MNLRTSIAARGLATRRRIGGDPSQGEVPRTTCGALLDYWVRDFLSRS
ncbi:hypothetical protein [Arthrobacter methylotrophus]